MPRHSAGLLMYRRRSAIVEVLLVHPGGPLWRNRDDGAWTIPKGEVGTGEDPLAAARREFEEETSHSAAGEFIPLGDVRLKSGKIVSAWAFEGDLDPATVHSNSFEMEWPPRSGRRQQYPEVDRADFFTLEQAAVKLNAAQSALIDRLARALGERARGEARAADQ